MRGSHLKQLHDVRDADPAAWRRLADTAVVPNPFFDPDFVLPAVDLYGDRVRLLVGGDWRAALPVVHQRWRRLPLPGLLTWLHPQCFLGTPLLAAPDAIRDLQRALRATTRRPLAELDLAAAELLGRLEDPAIRFGDFDRAAVVRRPQPTYLDGHISARTQRNLRRKRRGLAEALGGELAVSDHAGDPAAVDRFLDLEAAGWKGEQGTALAALPGGRAFLHAVCRGFADRGRLQLLALGTGDQVAAMRLNLRAGDEIFCFKIAYDEALGRFSPGLLLELDMIERFHADPTAQRMDSCADPRSELFNRAMCDRKPLGGALLTRGLAGITLRPGLHEAARRISAQRAA